MPEVEQADPPMDLQKEIGGALASIWARYVGARPASAETEVDGNVVRWILAGGTGEFEKGKASADEANADGPVRTLTGYRRELSAAVTKATHLRVVAQISKEKNGDASEVF